MPVSKVLRANPRPSDGEAILHLCQHQDQILPRGVREGAEADLSEEDDEDSYCDCCEMDLEDCECTTWCEDGFHWSIWDEAM